MVRICPDSGYECHNGDDCPVLASCENWARLADSKRLASEAMTLRDYFAGHALAGIGILEVGKNNNPQTMAATAYAIADAMIAERNRK